MPPSNVIDKLERLVNAGFQAIGARVIVERDGATLSVRNLLIEIERGRLNAYDSESTGSEPVFSVPASGLVSCASWVVINVTTGKAVRAIEDCMENLKSMDDGTIKEVTQ
ncbi:hypothetical protein [Roseibium sp. RKSG952]|uniref:hypothetical protein n=1 Tax=Roseibium sp. RKSG952 TaxID=2529384 RepID=UPI0012BD80F1|nr:hypothetical protein [Roseibium sp. RKSG952]MTH95905.1 hypothetical protein [Roseibium sp. RKSG952]